MDRCGMDLNSFDRGALMNGMRRQHLSIDNVDREFVPIFTLGEADPITFNRQEESVVSEEERRRTLRDNEGVPGLVEVPKEQPDIKSFEITADSFEEQSKDTTVEKREIKHLKKGLRKEQTDNRIKNAEQHFWRRKI